MGGAEEAVVEGGGGGGGAVAGVLLQWKSSPFSTALPRELSMGAAGSTGDMGEVCGLCWLVPRPPPPAYPSGHPSGARGEACVCYGVWYQGRGGGWPSEGGV